MPRHGMVIGGGFSGLGFVGSWLAYQLLGKQTTTPPPPSTPAAPSLPPPTTATCGPSPFLAVSNATMAPITMEMPDFPVPAPAISPLFSLLFALAMVLLACVSVYRKATALRAVARAVYGAGEKLKVAFALASPFVSAANTCWSILDPAIEKLAPHTSQAAKYAITAAMTVVYMCYNLGATEMLAYRVVQLETKLRKLVRIYIKLRRDYLAESAALRGERDRARNRADREATRCQGLTLAFHYRVTAMQTAANIRERSLEFSRAVAFSAIRMLEKLRARTIKAEFEAARSERRVAAKETRLVWANNQLRIALKQVGSERLRADAEAKRVEALTTEALAQKTKNEAKDAEIKEVRAALVKLEALSKIQVEHIEELTKRPNELKKELEEKTEELNTLSTAKLALETSVAELTKRPGELQSELDKKIAEMNEISATKATLEEANTDLTAQVVELTKRPEELKDELDKKIEQLNLVNATNATLDKSNVDVTMQVAELIMGEGERKQEMEKTKEELDELVARSSTFEASNATLTQEVEKLTKTNGELKDEMEKMAGQLQEVRITTSDLEASKATLTEQVGGLTQTNGEQNIDMQKMTTKFEELHTTHSSLETSSKASTEQAEKLSKQLKELESELIKKVEELDALRAAHSTLEASTSSTTSVAQVAESAKSIKELTEKLETAKTNLEQTESKLVAGREEIDALKKAHSTKLKTFVGKNLFDAEHKRAAELEARLAADSGTTEAFKSAVHELTQQFSMTQVYLEGPSMNVNPFDTGSGDLGTAMALVDRISKALQTKDTINNHKSELDTRDMELEQQRVYAQFLSSRWHWPLSTEEKQAWEVYEQEYLNKRNHQGGVGQQQGNTATSDEQFIDPLLINNDGANAQMQGDVMPYYGLGNGGGGVGVGNDLAGAYGDAGRVAGHGEMEELGGSDDEMEEPGHESGDAGAAKKTKGKKRRDNKRVSDARQAGMNPHADLAVDTSVLNGRAKRNAVRCKRTAQNSINGSQVLFGGGQADGAAGNGNAGGAGFFNFTTTTAPGNSSGGDNASQFAFGGGQADGAAGDGNAGGAGIFNFTTTTAPANSSGGANASQFAFGGGQAGETAGNGTPGAAATFKFTTTAMPGNSSGSVNGEQFVFGDRQAGGAVGDGMADGGATDGTFDLTQIMALGDGLQQQGADIPPVSPEMRIVLDRIASLRSQFNDTWVQDTAEAADSRLELHNELLLTEQNFHADFGHPPGIFELGAEGPALLVDGEGNEFVMDGLENFDLNQLLDFPDLNGAGFDPQMVDPDLQNGNLPGLNFQQENAGPAAAEDEGFGQQMFAPNIAHGPDDQQMFDQNVQNGNFVQLEVPHGNVGPPAVEGDIFDQLMFEHNIANGPALTPEEFERTLEDQDDETEAQDNPHAALAVDVTLLVGRELDRALNKQAVARRTLDEEFDEGLYD
ncbi:hypothetical protein LTR56_026004 [Elasticomyces elasticus]|nr:hypothetical protein LTR56_026004 [Elasticomyces elasticus]KAK3621806.1 hypothetical protein LTR22_025045 [Elasticomyces elasticus]KAK4905178.1 hypothetical protein LTR49_025493 [Elasticomyces elasticus]KAK5741964.1 hypothetical protein LTS12_024433 [Elasticomyces elasticus]